MNTARRPWLALALTVPLPTLGTCAAFWWWPGPVGGTLYFLSKLWVYALPVWWTRWVDGNSWSWSPMRKGGLGLGLAIGLAFVGVIVGLWFTVGASAVDVPAMKAAVTDAGFGSRWNYLGLVLYLCTVNSISEEYLFRWFMYRQLAARLTRTAAVFAAAAAFAVHHGVALQIQSGWLMALLGTLGTFIAGATWSWLYSRTESVWPGYLSHVLTDIGLFVVGWLIIFG